MVESTAKVFWDVKHVQRGKSRSIRIHRECFGAEKVDKPDLPFGFIRTVRTRERVGDGKVWHHVIQDDEVSFVAGEKQW